MFLTDCWYIAAWRSEVGEKPLARTICGMPIVLYRLPDGGIAALEDRCCHRNLPLSMGTIEQDGLRCGYHGLKFDASGACIDIPGQKQIPTVMRVTSYPLVERWGLVWIWLGDAAEADETELPRWERLTDPNLALAHGNHEKPLSMAGNWQLNNDNLLDLSHVFIVHRATLGAREAELHPIKSQSTERGVKMSRWTPNTNPIPVFAQYLGLAGDLKVDRWQCTDIELPGHCVVTAGFAPAGSLSPNDEAGYDDHVCIRAFISVTPETERSSFIFFIETRNFLRENAEVTRRVLEDIGRVFQEDIDVMEAQQRMTDLRPEAPMFDIRVDGPPLAMRRLVAGRIAAAAKSDKSIARSLGTSRADATLAKHDSNV